MPSAAPVRRITRAVSSASRWLSRNPAGPGEGAPSARNVSAARTTPRATSGQPAGMECAPSHPHAAPLWPGTTSTAACKSLSELADRSLAVRAPGDGGEVVAAEVVVAS